MDWKQLFTPVESIEPEDLKQYIADHPEGSYVLLDVRQPSEYEKEHIPGTRLMPLPSLADAYKALDPNRPVIVY